MYNLFMPEDQHEIKVVVVSCPKCPRSFKTLAWIAESKQPHCPVCKVAMRIAMAASA